MKKLISWLLIFVIFSLCGCSATKTTEENTESASKTESESYISEIIEEGKNYKITYIDHYIFPYISHVIEKDFDICLDTKTHFKIILEKVD